MSSQLLFRCSQCGAETDWDEDLGDNPLCLNCWDNGSRLNNKVAANQRRYYEENRDKVAANQRRYREENRDKLAANKRRYYEENRDKAAAYQRRYYEENRDKVAANQRQRRIRCLQRL